VTRRCRYGAAVAAALLAPAFLATSASATDVNIDEGTLSPSSLEIDDPADDRDVVTVTIVGPNVVVTDTGLGGVTPDGADCTALTPQAVYCPLDPPDPAPPAEPTLPIGFVDYDGDGGNDEITLSAALAGSDLEGGEGDDVLVGGELADDLEGEEGNDQVIGNGGDDSVEGMAGNDALSGGEGNDTLAGGGNNAETGGTDVLDGGPGLDDAGFFRSKPVTLTLDDVANDGFPGENDNLISVEGAATGSAADTIVGNDAQNFFFTGEGDDVIRGAGGRDDLAAGDGDDTIYGGAAVDRLSCGAGGDTAVVDADDIFTPGGGGGMLIARGTRSVDCERTGAEIGPDDTVFAKRGAIKVPIVCSELELGTCKGKAKLLINGKPVAKGGFKVAPGKTKKAKLKISKSGKRTLKRFGGSALATAQSATKLAGETSVHEKDVLVR
jgi:Ca2+-binding RTX toxin-like protein